MRFLLALPALPCLAQSLSVERLFTRPFPWNAENRGFKDLYGFHADEKRLVRPTAEWFDRYPLP